MPTKRWKSLQKKKQWYSQNAEQLKTKSSQNYTEHKEMINSRRKTFIQNDKTLQKHNKHRSCARAGKLQSDVVYKETNKARATARERVKLKESEEYRRQNIERATACMNRKLKDEKFKKENTTKAKISMNRGLQDDKVKELNKMRARNSMKRRLQDDKVKELNKMRTRNSMKQRLQDDKVKELNRTRASVSMKRRLQDDKVRELNRTRARIGMKRRLQDDKVREFNRTRASVSMKRRLQNETIRVENRRRANVNKKRKIAEDFECKLKNQERSRINTTRRLQLNEDYRERNKLRSRMRFNILKAQPWFKTYRKSVAQARRCKQTESETLLRPNKQPLHPDTNPDNDVEPEEEPPRLEPTSRSSDNKRRWTLQQRYWIRRHKLISKTVQQNSTLKQQKAILARSAPSLSLIDVQMLYNKSNRLLKKADQKMKLLHSHIVTKATDYLQKLPSNATEKDFRLAFDSISQHTKSSEPYFWEQGYKLYSTPDPIQIDSYGTAHIFPLASHDIPPVNESPEKEVHSQNTNQTHHQNKVKSWTCHPQLCTLDESSTRDARALFSDISRAHQTELCQFYSRISTCDNPARSDRLGHTLNCCAENGCCCHFRAARILSCHFPLLRVLVSRIYEVRRICCLSAEVRTAMAKDTFDALKRATDNLQSVVGWKRETGSSDSLDLELPTRISCNEESVMNHFGKALRLASNSRDTYNTEACDVCEEFRKDLKPLRSYEHRKGFESTKMSDMIDLLYQNKTTHEDLDEFPNSINICSYCADRLRSNKDVPRAVFNRLQVVDPPQCIIDLNLFERTLIKFCMTCVTMIRLGQISNTARPQKESNSALKGRIAYLPIDVSANSHFLPENILNFDSLVLMVGGQPTQKKRIWTFVVDLRKVHAALAWLRENNPLYTDVPAYSVEDLQRIVDEKVQRDPSAVHESEPLLLKKLDEAARSHLYENFTVQPLSSEFPADIMLDYQLNKVHGNNINIFDTDLDLKAFSELFPTGKNGMKDVTRTTNIGTSDFIKSRLLNKHPQFRLNINYLFHCFQVQEVSICVLALAICSVLCRPKASTRNHSWNVCRTVMERSNRRCFPSWPTSVDRRNTSPS